MSKYYATGRAFDRRRVLAGSFWRAVSIFFCTCFALTAAGCGGGDESGTTVRKGGLLVKSEVEQEGGFFYRLFAAYKVVETGEPVNFDIIVACNIRTTHYSYTGPSWVAERAPEVIAKATSAGHAVMIKTPRFCQWRDLEDVPPDFIPFAVWFDDVDDLSFGWGYATQDAYERENAELAYVYARVERATRADWEKWRKKAAEGWEQIGALPGPWGYSQPKDEAGKAEQARVRALNGGKWLALPCRSIARIALPPDAMATIEEAAARDPGAFVTDRFVGVIGSPSVVEAERALFKRGRKEPIFGGYTSLAALQEVEGTMLRPPAVGWVPRARGTHHHGYREEYPSLRYEKNPPDINSPHKGSVRQILLGERWKGLAGCGAANGVADSNAIDDGRLPEELALPGKFKHPFYLNDELLFEDMQQITPGGIRLFERSGFLWSGY